MKIKRNVLHDIKADELLQRNPDAVKMAADRLFDRIVKWYPESELGQRVYEAAGRKVADQLMGQYDPNLLLGHLLERAGVPLDHAKVQDHINKAVLQFIENKAEFREFIRENFKAQLVKLIFDSLQDSDEYLECWNQTIAAIRAAYQVSLDRFKKELDEYMKLTVERRSKHSEVDFCSPPR